MRIPWDEYFMMIARLVSTRSTCLRRQVGAVIVRGKRILATGYNGQLPGLWHCSEETQCYYGCPTRECEESRACPYVPAYREKFRKVGCCKQVKGDARYCRAVHAEANAICQAAAMGIPLNGAVIYSTTKPCPECIKLIASVGIKRVYYEEDYYQDDPELWRFWASEAGKTGIDFVRLVVTPEALKLARAVLE